MDARQIIWKCMFCIKVQTNLWSHLTDLEDIFVNAKHVHVFFRSRIQKSVPKPISFKKIEGPGSGTVLMIFGRCFDWIIGHLWSFVYLFPLFYGNGMRRGVGFKTRSKYCFYQRTPALAFYLWCHRSSQYDFSRSTKNFTYIKILNSGEFCRGWFYMPSLWRKSSNLSKIILYVQ